MSEQEETLLNADDAEGHYIKGEDEDVDDAEGHFIKGEDEDDDTEGHHAARGG